MLTKFWLGRASEPLTPNGRARWEFLVAGAAATLEVRSMIENHYIETAWDDDTIIDFSFSALDQELTLVRVTQAGFAGSADEVVAKALDATQGFTLVLCELKALLEQNVQLNAVRDKAHSIEQANTPPSSHLDSLSKPEAAGLVATAEAKLRGVAKEPASPSASLAAGPLQRSQYPR